MTAGLIALCAMQLRADTADGMIVIEPLPTTNVLINPGKGWSVMGNADGQPKEILKFAGMGVRRFNWLDHAWAKPLDLQLNPDVSVRRRGVMEKCTFCIQRIREVQWRAKREKRKVLDGEVAPACVQSCPARAFTFGDLLDEGSMVSQLTRQVRMSPDRLRKRVSKLATRPSCRCCSSMRWRSARSVQRPMSKAVRPSTSSRPKPSVRSNASLTSM